MIDKLIINANKIRDLFKVKLYAIRSETNKTKHLIDVITSNNGYRWKIGLIILTHRLSYPQSRDAIASKKSQN